MSSRLLIATNNLGKAAEIKTFLQNSAVEVLTLRDFPNLPPVVEDGDSFSANALKKAHFAAVSTGITTLADDSGLAVDALNGQPGVYSARFAGDGADDEANNKKLLQLLQGVSPAAKRSARFICAIAIVTAEGEIFYAHGQCKGLIIDAPRGSGGFGYDPLFYVPELQKTMAELNISEKNMISHRGIALREAEVILADLFNNK